MHTYERKWEFTMLKEFALQPTRSIDVGVVDNLPCRCVEREADGLIVQVC
jgi:hypothetical protein